MSAVVSTVTPQVSVSEAVHDCIRDGSPLTLLEASIDENAADAGVPVEQLSENVVRLQFPARMILIEGLARNIGTTSGRRVSTSWATVAGSDGRRRKQATFSVGGHS